MSTQLAVAIPAGFLGAATFAGSAVLQQRAARQAPEDESLSWRLIRDLLHRPLWLAGVGCTIAGFVLQAVALGFAPVAFVEPVLGTEIALALPVAARLRRVKLGFREWAGAVCVVAGVATFLLACRAAGGNSRPGLFSWASAAGPALAVAVLAVLAARGPESPRRATLLALAAGITFSVMALLTQSFVQLLGAAGVAGALSSWQPYAMALLGPLGFTVAQSAYQSGPLAMSLPVLDSLEPTLAVVLAAVAFHQHLAIAGWHGIAEGTAAVTAIFGIFLLGRSPLVLSLYQQTQQQKDKRERSGSEKESAAA